MENKNLPTLPNKHHHGSHIFSFLHLLENLLGASSRNSRTDLRENGDELILSVDIPGFDPRDLDITVQDDVVIIKGDQRQEELYDQPGYYFASRSCRGFYRTVPLPAGIKPENTVARFDNGVLELKMSKGQSLVRSFKPLAGSEKRPLLE